MAMARPLLSALSCTQGCRAGSTAAAHWPQPKAHQPLSHQLTSLTCRSAVVTSLLLRAASVCLLVSILSHRYMQQLTAPQGPPTTSFTRASPPPPQYHLTVRAGRLVAADGIGCMPTIEHLVPHTAGHVAGAELDQAAIQDAQQGVAQTHRDDVTAALQRHTLEGGVLSPVLCYAISSSTARGIKLRPAEHHQVSTGIHRFGQSAQTLTKVHRERVPSSLPCMCSKGQETERVMSVDAGASEN